MADEQRTLAVNLTANASGFANGTNEAIQKLRELNTQVAENKQNIKQTSAEMKEYQRKLNELKAATDGGRNATEAEKQEMQRLRDAIARCAADIGSYQTAQQRLQSQIRNTNRELDEQRGSAEKVNEAFSTMGEVLKANLLSGAITAALEKLTGALQTCASYAYNVGSRFEAGMSQVEAISGASGATLDELTEKAKALGASTRFSASEAAQAMNYMAMAGWDAQQMLSGIDGVLSLAAASGADLGETADIVTDAITAFGLAAEDVGHFSDVLAAASANANTNVSMLGESFKYVAPLAGTMGYSIDEVAEALGIMANSGIKASTAGTSMRTILTNLTSGVTVSAEAFGEMEITAANADGSMKSLNEVLGELREAFALMTDAEKTTNGNLIAGDRALSGFLSLVNAAPADIDKLRTAIENADGSAGDMAQTMTENVAGSVTIMNSALESLGIAVFEKFGDRINNVVVKITDAVTDLSERIDGGELDDTFESLADSLGEAADEVADFIQTGLPRFVEGLAKALTTISNLKTEISAGVAAFVAFKTAMAVGNVINGVTTALKGAATAQAALNAAMAANPVGLVATALAALTFGVIAFANAADDAADEVNRLHEEAAELNNDAEKSKQEAENISDLAEEYEKLGKQEKLTADEKERLKKIQDELVSKFGYEASEIDLVNGKYEEQLELIRQLSEEKAKDAGRYANDAKIRKDRAETVEMGRSSFWDLENGGRQLSIAEQEKLLATLQKSDLLPWFQVDDSDRATDGSLQALRLTINGNTAQKKAAYNQLLQALDDSGLARNGSQELKEWYSALVSEYKELSDTDLMNQQIEDNFSRLYLDKNPNAMLTGSSVYAAEQKRRAEQAEKLRREQEQAAAMSAEERAEYYKQQKQLADDMYSAEEITAAEYYDRLTALRDNYLEKGTHEWYQATSQIKKLGKQLGSLLGDAAADDAEKVKAALSDIQQSYKDTIAEIDKEFERRSQQRTRAQEDEDYYAKREALTTRLAYDNLDSYSRRSLEKQLAELDKEREDVLWERSGEDRKQSVENAYETGQELLNGSPLGGMAKEDWAQAVSLVTDEVIRAGAAGKLDSNVNAVNKYINIVINNQGKSEEQIRKLVVDTITSDSV